MMAEPNLTSLTHTIMVGDLDAALKGGLAAAVSAAAPASISVAVFNCAAATATSISIGSAIVTPSAGLAGFGAGSASPSYVTCQVSSLSFNIQASFGAVGWTSNVAAVGLSATSVCIWCFSNGFVLTTAAGALVQISFSIA